MAIALRQAAATDLAAVQALLAAASLPFEDIAPQLPHFAVADEDGRIVGVAGIERYGAAGLLRSVCVAPDRQGRGLAGTLVELVEAWAMASGVEDLYLLTTTAEPYFAARGFTPIGRESVPEAIRATTEFSTLCPSSAVCMHRSLAELPD
jgi:amino-acid N-acetyltransferase